MYPELCTDNDDEETSFFHEITVCDNVRDY